MPRSRSSEPQEPEGERPADKEGEEDNRTYRRNVRNMALVLAAIAIVIFASIFIPPLIGSGHEQFSSKSSVNSPNGYTLNLVLNTSRLAPGERLALDAWINNTGKAINQLPAQQEWPIPNVTDAPCGAVLPIRIGILSGYYSVENVSLGQFLQLSFASVSCPATAVSGTPQYFLMQPLSSQTILQSSSGVGEFDISVSCTTGSYVVNASEIRFSGVFTAVAMDEWGDLALTHFIVTFS